MKPCLFNHDNSWIRISAVLHGRLIQRTCNSCTYWIRAAYTGENLIWITVCKHIATITIVFISRLERTSGFSVPFLFIDMGQTDKYALLHLKCSSCNIQTAETRISELQFHPGNCKLLESMQWEFNCTMAQEFIRALKRCVCLSECAGGVKPGNVLKPRNKSQFILANNVLS